MAYPLRAVMLLALLSVPFLHVGTAVADEVLQSELRLQFLGPNATEVPASSAFPHSPELQRVYQMRNFVPLWQSPARRAALASAIDSVGEDGLDPGRYWQAKRPYPATDSIIQLAQADIAATEACLRALTDLQRGQVEMLQTGQYWRADSFPLSIQAQPADALAYLADDDIGAVFDRFRPKTALYLGLRQALAQAILDLAANGEWPKVSEGPTLKAGMDDPRVVELRARLVASGHLAAEHAIGSQVDEVLFAAVQAFQRDHGLEPDGSTGRATLAALNTSRADRIAQLRINLERARWISYAQHGDHVLVDIAGYRLSYMHGDEERWSARTQVGMHDRETPELLSRITHFTVNPTWTVPPTILRKDIIPKASTDPDYLASRNIRVLDRDGIELDPAFVDWQHTGGLTFRQDFGDGSALGKVAIRFSNPYAIYLHDTPNQRQFKRTQRSFSSGCVRVENALDLAGVLLENAGAKGAKARFDALLASGKSGNLTLARPVPIIAAYLTAGPDDAGRITFRPDVYTRDAALLRALTPSPQ